MNKNILYLGSKSPSRQLLLTIADIPFKVLPQDSDECVIDTGLSFDDYVLEIARLKMAHVVLPAITSEGEELFVLTADTLVQLERSGERLGKPEDREDAKRMLRLLRNEPAYVVTACCLEKKRAVAGKWTVVALQHWCVSTTVEFCVEEDEIDTYLEKLPLALHQASAGSIEGYGHNFVKSIRGSFSAVLGLPMYELRQALKQLQF